MPYKFLTLEGLGRLGTRLKAALTSKHSDESITGQFTFEGDPLFNLDTDAIDRATMPPANLRFIDVTNNQEIGDLYLKNTDNLYYDLETAPAVDGYDFVSMEYNSQDEKFDLYYIPLTNPVVSSYSELNSCISQGIVPNTKNMKTSIVIRFC